MRPAVSVSGIKVSNPDRVIDKSSGATKIDLVRYYDRVAERMLPHLKGRPAALVRAPAGIGGELFFQKHLQGRAENLEVNSKPALVGAAQMNVVEFHTWNSTTKAIDKPDRVIFDLDPGKGIRWSQIVEATQVVKKFLDMLELESFLKTSGGKGLHVVVPLTRRLGYDEVKDFSQSVVVHLATTLPKLFVSKSGPQNRVGRIFVDYLRNGRGATTVAAFSARARPGLAVSVPLKWSELAKLEGSDQWNIFSVHERLAKLLEDPWKDYWKAKQSITAARRRLG